MSDRVSEQIVSYSKAIKHMLERRELEHRAARAKERARLRESDFSEFKGGCR